MLIQQYDAETGQYISSRLAAPDPRNVDRWSVPAFSTVVAGHDADRAWLYRNGVALG